MKRHIRLSDLAHLPDPVCSAHLLGSEHDYPRELIAEARKTLAAAGLRVDNTTGTVRDNDGELSRFVHRSDFTPHPDEEHVMRWAFRCEIMNAAGRLHRGHSAR